MGRLLAAFAISAVLLNGCNQERRAEKKPSASGVILSTTVAPDSAFQMSVSFDPAPPRMSTKTKFRIKLLDLAGAPVSGAQVQASLVMPLMDMGKNQFTLTPVGNGEYEATGEFTMAGEWEVTVRIGRPGQKDIQEKFMLAVQQ